MEQFESKFIELMDAIEDELGADYHVDSIEASDFVDLMVWADCDDDQPIYTERFFFSDDIIVSEDAKYVVKSVLFAKHNGGHRVITMKNKG